MATFDLPADLAVPDATVIARRQAPAREFVAIGGLVTLADIVLFRGQGYAGLALFFLLAPALLFLGRWGTAAWRTTTLVGFMLLLLSLRSVWLGSVLGTLFGMLLVIAFAMTLHGRRPFVLELLAFTAQLLWSGMLRIPDYWQGVRDRGPHIPRLAWMSILLPTFALVMFGGLFVLANPDLVTALNDRIHQLAEWLSTRIASLEVDALEVIFCLFIMCLSIGMLRPWWKSVNVVSPEAEVHSKVQQRSEPFELYGAVRNTLIAVILLFAVYLVFEFATLWFREFPAGFHYSGYAHQGAGWLTVALALATLVLSLIFRGDMLRDPRLPALKRLAWIWSIENLLLAATVYNRMHIYVDFNGMTRMRVVGLFGITAVVVGFALVLWKIHRRKDFVWLVRGQLLTVAIAAYLFVLTPVDYLVHRYNVRQILAGDPAPAVQISVHPISSEGVLVLAGLLDTDDVVIREGICAMLAEKAIEIQTRLEQRQSESWTSYQLADQVLLNELDTCRTAWEPYLAVERRSPALDRFHKYAYRWF